MTPRERKYHTRHKLLRLKKRAQNEFTAKAALFAIFTRNQIQTIAAQPIPRYPLGAPALAIVGEQTQELVRSQKVKAIANSVINCAESIVVASNQMNDTFSGINKQLRQLLK